jgi:hypothetical protein
MPRGTQGSDKKKATEERHKREEKATRRDFGSIVGLRDVSRGSQVFDGNFHFSFLKKCNTKATFG